MLYSNFNYINSNFKNETIDVLKSLKIIAEYILFFF